MITSDWNKHGQLQKWTSMALDGTANQADWPWIEITQ